MSTELSFAGWYDELERRHLATLTFSEVRHALQALSSIYVERRDALQLGRALDTAGKRAAFALFYGAIHFLTAREIVRALGAHAPPPTRLVDLGCGTGAVSAAWASLCNPSPQIDGVDRNAWATEEARVTYRAWGLAGRARTGDLVSAVLPGAKGAVVAGWSINELGDGTRRQALSQLLAGHQKGARILIIEPIARSATPWWAEWERGFTARGGRADEWRFPAELPERLALLDKAAGLDHRELTGRSLYL